MNIWTVQCGFAAYECNTVEVEADTLEDACDAAIALANESDGWSPLDVSSKTFVDAIARGADTDPWTDFASSLPVPQRFTERGEAPLVTIIVSGGVVQDVAIEGGKVRVHVHDYDTDEAPPDDPDLQTDADGARYALADWSNDVPPHDAAEIPRGEIRVQPEGV
ncbi:MAG TPA: hypothetical protein VIJ62_13075 [Rhizomicrobium sp.]